MAYLILVVALIAVGALILWLRERRPTSVQSSIEDFRRGLDALAPGPAPARRRRRGGGQPAV